MKTHNIKWTVNPGWHEEQIENILSAFYKTGITVRLVKGKRETRKVLLGDKYFYVKMFYHDSIVARLISLFKRKGEYEFNMNNAVSAFNINVPKPVAYGSEESAGFILKEILITEEIKGSKTLIEYLDTFNRLSHDKQKKVISEFADFIRGLHEIGIKHSDFHGGNVLITCEDNKSSFYLIDLYEVKLKPELSKKELLSNLIQLNVSFLTLVDDSSRYYFFNNYIKGEMADKIKPEYINTIKFKSLKLARAIWKQRGKRCIQSNKGYLYLKKGDKKIYLQEGINGIADLLKTPDSYLDGANINILKDGNTVKAARVELSSGPPLFLKRYNNKGIVYTLKNIFRSSRAKQVWKNSNAFKLRGIPTPDPLAFIEERRWRLLKSSYVVFEYINNSEILNNYFSGSHIGQGIKDELMRSIGYEIGRMHKLGCIHGDLKWTNIIVRRRNDHYDVYFTDLDGSSVRKKVSRSDRVRDLGRFYLDIMKYNATDMDESFFSTYWKTAPSGESFEEFRRDVIKRAAKLRERPERK